MFPIVEFVTVFGTFFALIGLGLAIPFSIAVSGLLYLFFFDGLTAFKALGLISWGGMDSFTLTAAPLFIFMADILQKSGLGLRIYDGMAKLVVKVPGGLLQTNIVSCALFGGASGSSVATAVAIGGVALPELERRKYEPKISAGSIAAGGTLGILLPPSIPMIIYGSVTETSVAQLFMGGVVPGLLLAAMFMGYIAMRARMDRSLAPEEAGPKNFAEILLAIGNVLPFLGLMGGILLVMYLGLMTPTEAAAAGVILASIVAKIWGNLTWATFSAALSSTVRTSANLLFIIFAAMILSYAIGRAGIGEALTEYIVSLGLSKWQLFGVLLVVYVLMGCFLESMSLILITVPLIFPVLMAYGVDPIWFGIMLMIIIELGQITPPLGINLFVIKSIWHGSLGQVVRGTVPFYSVFLLLIVVLTLIPGLVTWLPGLM
ncbi:C4-dicarboxylate ABC transporter [Thioclava sp. F34-6]|uniref:TRAP transporter large permease n=1 Tax=Thioclava sp. F34-6 TaxID=1973003 RepID=UPI000B542256|nr:TRAP transporter large permease [Thioclava sp. F34-6]OWY08856.1 C4-dicarboxylate ABC transporter [Thioclava sp. F34-6]